MINMNKLKKFFVYLIVFIVLVFPVISSAQDTGIIPCDNVKTPCDYNALMDLINTLIDFALVKMAVPLCAIMFAYAGFEMVTSAGSSEKKGMAKKVFTNAVMGLVIAASAFLIVKTLLHILGYDGAWIFEDF